MAFRLERGVRELSPGDRVQFTKNAAIAAPNILTVAIVDLDPPLRQ